VAWFKKWWWALAVAALVGAWAYFRLRKKRANRRARQAAVGKTSTGVASPMNPNDPQASPTSTAGKVLQFVQQTADDIVSSDDADTGITMVTGDAPQGGGNF